MKMNIDLKFLARPFSLMIVEDYDSRLARKNQVWANVDKDLSAP